jgi:hypothetical protein
MLGENMKQNNPETVNAEKMIALRPGAELGAAFWQIVNDLGITSSDLAKRCLTHGLEPAVKEIVKERQKSASRIERHIKGGKSLFSLPQCGCGEGWSSPFLLPVG